MFYTSILHHTDLAISSRFYSFIFFFLDTTAEGIMMGGIRVEPGETLDHPQVSEDRRPEPATACRDSGVSALG